MKFQVFGETWGGGAPDPLWVLKRYVAATPVSVPPPEPRMAQRYEVEVTAAELMAMVEAKDFDILITNGLLAFDGKGRGFHQR